MYTWKGIQKKNKPVQCDDCQNDGFPDYEWEGSFWVMIYSTIVQNSNEITPLPWVYLNLPDELDVIQLRAEAYFPRAVRVFSEWLGLPKRDFLRLIRRTVPLQNLIH